MDKLIASFPKPAGYFREIFRRTIVPYTVSVRENEFVIRREARLFDLWQRYYLTYGKVEQIENQLHISLCYEGWNHFFTLYYTILMIFYAIAGYSVFTIVESFDLLSTIFCIVMIAHLALMIVSPLIIMRKVIAIRSADFHLILLDQLNISRSSLVKYSFES